MYTLLIILSLLTVQDFIRVLSIVDEDNNWLIISLFDLHIMYSNIKFHEFF